MTLFVFAVSVFAAAWVWYDASTRDWSRSRVAKSAWQWALGTLLLWIVVLPLYVIKRRHAPALR